MSSSTQLHGLVCHSCSTENSAGARFCRNCGRALDATLTGGRTVVITPQVLSPIEQPIRTPTTLLHAAPRRTQTSGFRVEPIEHTVFTKDVSGSMGAPYDNRFSKMEAAQRGACSMVQQKAQIDANDQCAVVSFDDAAQVRCPLVPLSTSKSKIIQAIQSLSVGGGTDINEGLKAARDLFDWDRSDVVRRVILLTDGQGGHPLSTSDDLKKRGVVIDVIGVGESPSGVDEKLLRKVASTIAGENRYSFIKNTQTLVAHYTTLAQKTKTC